MAERLLKIDAHTHAGTVRLTDPRQRNLTVHQLVDRMNRLGIDQAVLLPLESPEAFPQYYPTVQVLADVDVYPERLIPFGVVDPRQGQREIEAKLKVYIDAGIRGFGEHKTGLRFDDPRSIMVYRLAGELGLPVLFHLDRQRNFDEVGLPGLERVLRELPGTTFIAHGPLWWAHISAEVDPTVAYPTGPVQPGGAVDRLLTAYPNLYADLSAASGYNALTRDPTFTAGFLERHWGRLVFGTDYLRAGQELPIVTWLEQCPLHPEKKAAIWGGTLSRLLRPL